jgi:hypothetical protein
MQPAETTKAALLGAAFCFLATANWLLTTI